MLILLWSVLHVRMIYYMSFFPPGPLRSLSCGGKFEGSPRRSQCLPNHLPSYTQCLPPNIFHLQVRPAAQGQVPFLQPCDNYFYQQLRSEQQPEALDQDHGSSQLHQPESSVLLACQITDAHALHTVHSSPAEGPSRPIFLEIAPSHRCFLVPGAVLT